MERNIIKIDEAGLKDDLKTLIRGTVEDTLNAMLDEEAASLCNAEKHERSEGRRNYRSGHYHRKLLTGAGELDIAVPKLRLAPFETAIIERYRRRESSVEESLIEMYLAGVSVRRVEDVTELLWGSRVSASTVSNLNQKVYGKIEEWRNRPLTGEYPYVFVDGINLPEAQLGRRDDQRVGAGGHRRERRWLPRDPRRGGRCEREQGMLEIVPARPEGTRLEGGAAVHLGQAPGLPGIRIGGLPGCQMAALYGSLLQERVHEGAPQQVRRSGRPPQGHLRPGGPRGHASQGQGR